jgi:CBS domain-containing membrane protein
MPTRLKDLGRLKWHIIWQLFCAMAYVAAVLLVLGLVDHDTTLWAIGASSLASSAYLVFANPSAPVSRYHKVIGGYLIAVLVGLLVHILLHHIFTHMSMDLGGIIPRMFWITATIAVGLSMFLMVILGYEHPPAAGVALVLVLDTSDYYTLFVILGAAMVLAILKKLLKFTLVDLV